MFSTHYMDLLMQNSPWNLIVFMAIPVILAETIAVTDLFLLKSPGAHPTLAKVNRIAAILAGATFVAIIAYFIPKVIIPLAAAGEFRTWVDAVAIFSYVLAGIPMILLALVNLNLVFRKSAAIASIILLASFLALSHVAMIFGMVDPGIAGYVPKDTAAASMHHHAAPPTQNHPAEHRPAEHHSVQIQQTPARPLQMDEAAEDCHHQQ